MVVFNSLLELLTKFMMEDIYKEWKEADEE